MSTEHGSKIKFKVRYVASCTTAKVMKHQTRMYVCHDDISILLF